MSFAWHEIRDHLSRSSSTLNFQRSFEALRHAQAALAPFRDPAALLDGLHRTSGDPVRKNVILSALVEAAQKDGPTSDCALTLLVLALWPGLDAIRRRSVWRKLGAADEIASEVLARITEAVHSLDRDRVNRVAATVLRNVERDMIRARMREARREEVATEIDPDEIPAGHGLPDENLHRARLADDMHRVIGADADLVSQVAVEGFTQGEVAAQLGLSEAAARKRYQRATRRLREHFSEIV